MKIKTTHRHGGTPGYDIQRLNLSERPVIDFSVNLNPLGPPDNIRDHWMEMFNAVENYPSIEGDGVTHFYSKKYGVSPDNIMPGNGSTELIYLLPRILGFKKIIVVTPSYNDYSRASQLAGAQVVMFPLKMESLFAPFQNNEIAECLQDADALWLGNPNNPTGTLFHKQRLLELAEQYPEKYIIIDEAFMPFLEKIEEQSMLMAPPRPNVIVIHSITKFYALAGLRLGGVFGSESVIGSLKNAKEPWTINGIAERIAPLLLHCDSYEKETRSLIAKERERLYSSIKSIKGIQPFPPSANFILCHWRLTDNLDDLIRLLLSEGLYIRDCRNFSGLENNFFRVAVRTPRENDLFISTISSVSKNLNA